MIASARHFHAILAYSQWPLHFGRATCAAAILTIAASADSASPLSSPSSPANAHPLASVATPAPPTTDDPPPLEHRISFRLADGRRLSGTLTAITPDDFSGSFGTYRWNELQYQDVWRIFRRVMDGTSIDDWLALGRALLLMSLDQPDSARWADRAFMYARRLAPDDPPAPPKDEQDAPKDDEKDDEKDKPDREGERGNDREADQPPGSGPMTRSAVESHIRAIRNELAALRDRRQDPGSDSPQNDESRPDRDDRGQDPDEQQPQDTDRGQDNERGPSAPIDHPPAAPDAETGQWPAVPWPAMTRHDHRNAVLIMKSDAQSVLEHLPTAADGSRPTYDFIETAHTLLYTDLERPDAVRFALLMPKIVEQFAQILQRDPSQNPFWGKAAIFITSDQDHFVRFETLAFGSSPIDPNEPLPRSRLHRIGPKVFITIHHPGPRYNREIELELTRQLTRGLLHRHISPQELPDWAADGLAITIADRLFRDTPLMNEHRRVGLAFIRDRRAVTDVLAVIDPASVNQGRPAARAPHDRRLIASLGGLIIELMIRERPGQFSRWIEAVKRGVSWRDALQTDYNVPLEVLLDTAVRYYRVND
jgi:hypothetical protein